MRPGMLARPFAVKSGQIGNPNRKIAGMADKGIVRQPDRSTLHTPIETGHMPPCLMKMGNGFQIFLENIATTRKEQNRHARSNAGGRPVDKLNSPAVRGGPLSERDALRKGREMSPQDRNRSCVS